VDLEIGNVYNDHTWAELDAVLTPDEKQQVLADAQAHFEAYGIEGIECEIEEITQISRWSRWVNKAKVAELNRALVISADFEPYLFKGILTISTFGCTTVMGTYKVFSGEDDLFAVNYNAEVRRRCVIDCLNDVEQIDRFFLIDKCLDVMSEYLTMKLRATVKRSLVAPVPEPA